MASVQFHKPPRWVSRGDAAPADVRRLREGAGLPEWLARALVVRGIEDADQARRYLSPGLRDLHSVHQLDGIEPVVSRLLRARAEGVRVGVHGDYDVDGLASTALVVRVLRTLGFDALPFVPHRLRDGYGLSPRGLRWLHSHGVGVVITCDAGSSDGDVIRWARDELGLDVLVTDHHLVDESPVAAEAFVNPQATGSRYPFPHLCGTGVAYKVLEALLEATGESPEACLAPYLDLVALATVCDVVPLTDENRVFVAEGLPRFADSRVPGLRALLELVKVPPSEVSEHALGWLLGPRLNAPGRIGEPAQGLELLLTDDPARARSLAASLESINEQRIELTRRIQEQVFQRIDRMDLDALYGIALGPERGQGDLWHPGILGIVAGRVVERYSRPAFLFSRDPDTGSWKGSGRAPDHSHVHLHAVLSELAPHLARFGGHRLAAGASLPAQGANLEAFARAFDERCRAATLEGDRIPTLYLDSEVELAELSAAGLETLSRMAPFGHGNDPVQVAVRGVSILWAKPAGREKRHLKVAVESHGRTLEVLGRDLAVRFPHLVRSGHRWRGDLLLRFEEEIGIGGRRIPFVLADLGELQREGEASGDGLDLLERLPSRRASPEASGQDERVRGSACLEGS